MGRTPGAMQISQFLPLPILMSTLTLTSGYSLPSNSLQPSDFDHLVVTEQVVEIEVNPTPEEEVGEQVEVKEVPRSIQPVPSVNNATVIEANGVTLHPNLVPICRCESGLNQFEADGITVLRGRVNPLDIGICQINLKYHGEAAERLQYDLFTLEGNIRYANHLYTAQGATPWKWSAPCHGQY